MAAGEFPTPTVAETRWAVLLREMVRSKIPSRTDRSSSTVNMSSFPYLDSLGWASCQALSHAAKGRQISDGNAYIIFQFWNDQAGNFLERASALASVPDASVCYRGSGRGERLTTTAIEALPPTLPFPI